MRYAISDIHGCVNTFRLALETIGFRHGDELFLLGDYIDCGPDSQGVLNYIWQLEADGHQLVCLRGNHEQMLLDYHQRQYPLYEWTPEQKLLSQTLQWLNQLHYYCETPGYILVHAGLDFLNEDPFADKEEMLWIRYWYGDIDRQWLGDRIIVHGHTPGRMLEVKRSLKHLPQTQVACIDSGCSQKVEGMGYLTVFNLDTQEATFVRNID